MRAYLVFAAVASGILALAGQASAQSPYPVGEEVRFLPLTPALAPALELRPPAMDVAAPRSYPRFDEHEVSPGGAFLRSLLLPGWGHVATGSPGRGAFYVAAQSGSLWMLWKSITRRGTARAAAELERGIVAARLERQGITDPETLFILVDQDPAVEGWEALIANRGQQVEDWAAMSIFLVLLGAADAFVAAHLRDFPEPLSLRAGSPPDMDGIELGISLSVGGGASPRH